MSDLCLVVSRLPCGWRFVPDRVLAGVSNEGSMVKRRLRKDVEFREAFHRCHPDPSQNYGIGGIAIDFLLVDEERREAVTWRLLTSMGLPDEQFRAQNPDCLHPAHQRGYPVSKPVAGEIRYHSRKPVFEGQKSVDDCELVGAGCYSDVDFSGGDAVYKELAETGDPWTILEQKMDEYFGRTESE